MSEKEKTGFNPESGKEPVKIVDVELTKNEHLPGEVKDWMQRVETNNLQSNLMNDLSTQQNHPHELNSTASESAKLTVTKNVFLTGFKTSIQDAHRWLSEFLLRMIKIKKGKVIFKEE